MSDSFRRLVLCTVVLSSVSPLPAATHHEDEAEIRAVAMRQGETWSRHDAKAYAGLFTEDCDVVNVVGWWWKGRAELERKLTAAFTYTFSESQLTITDVQVRFLSPNIALAHARWTMTGARTPPGIPEPRSGIQTLVFTKQAEHWLIAGFQNTHSIPEQPFPTAPTKPPERKP
ncbi:MAG: SgcJ/EcaC family oxidoreductase [Thermoanaerobaculia bacterium]